MPRPLVRALLLVLLTVAAYLPALRAGYVWDDDSYVTANRALTAPGGLHAIWTDRTATPQYYPLVFTSFWLERRLWGTDPFFSHAVNVLLHALAAVLAWQALRRLEVPGAWLAAALFALHPVHVESVAWIAERKNVLSGVFYLAALLAWWRFAYPSGGARDGRWWAVALLLFTAALLSKTVTATLPVALLVLVWWNRSRPTRREALSLVPFFLLGAGFGLLTAWLEKERVGAAGPEWALGALERCLVAGRALWFYLGKLLWPHPLIFIYPRWTPDRAAAAQWAFPLAAVALAVVLWRARARIGRGPFAAALFFALTLAPALGFVDVYPMRFSFVADHFQYLASLGPLALAAATAWQLAAAAARHLAARGRHLPPALPGALAGVVLAVLGVLTWTRTLAFADEATLWRDTLARNPGAWIAHNNLGRLLEQDGRAEAAAGHYRAALALKPDYPEPHVNLGNLAAAAGRLDDAVGEYRTALRLDPRSADALTNLGNVWLLRGDLGGAEAAYRQAIVLRPALAEAHQNIGYVLVRRGQLAEAAAHLREALELRPDWPRALDRLARILATAPDPALRDAPAAVRLAERACARTSFLDAAFLDTLALAYAATGRSADAARTAEAALARAQAVGNAELARDLAARLEGYRAGAGPGALPGAVPGGGSRGE